MSMESQTVLATDGQFQDVRYEVVWIGEPNPEDYERAREIVGRAFEPAPREQIMRLLARLKVLVVQRDADHNDLALQFAAYTDELAAWPGDIAVHVLETQPKMSKWWPAWSELDGRLRSCGSRRLALAVAMQV